MHLGPTPVVSQQGSGAARGDGDGSRGNDNDLGYVHDGSLKGKGKARKRHSELSSATKRPRQQGKNIFYPFIYHNPDRTLTRRGGRVV